MMLFRPVKENDVEAIYQLADEGGIGITTLPKDKKVLQERIYFSLMSFAKKTNVPLHENYLFVLEDTDNKKIVGTSAIEAALGYELPFYSYRISQISRICHDLDIRMNYHSLNLVNDFQGQSEICTLFLSKAYRKNDNGLLLSRARFLFMAAFKARFANEVIAEMRGVSNENGESPFWESVGRHFFAIDFHEADKLSALTNKQFIADLMPRNSIYVHLLSKAAQKVIGEPHESTIPALKILKKEGFYYNNYVDIFDAGPTIKCRLADIRSVKQSQSMVVKSVINTVHAKHHFISNAKIDFKALKAEVMVKEDGCIIDRKVAEILAVAEGDNVRLVPVS